MDAGRKYCICCGEEVPYNIVERNERRELTCSYCGFTLDVENLWEDIKVSIDTYAFIAEDSDFARKLLKELVLKKSLASEVIAVTNGLELVTEYTKLMKQKILSSFAIIDLNMPVMDGLTAARTIRALEEKEGTSRVPIVFFSGVKADESLKKQMELLTPAHYMNKGSDPNPENLIKRVQGLLNFISQRYKRE
jgi:CheY-like chemotaxis protein